MSSMTLTFADAVATARAALAEAVASPTPAHELRHAISELESLARHVYSVQAQLIRQADHDDLARTTGARNTATWLQDALNINPGQARGRVEIATADTGLAKQALADGAIGVEHAQVITTCLRKLPRSASGEAVRVETVLTEQARRCRPWDLRQLAEGINAGFDRQTALADERAQHESRELHYVTSGDGTVQIKARLDKETGQKFIAALRPLSKPCPAHDGRPDPRTPGQRHADGLATLVDLALGAEGMPGVGGQRVQIQVAVDYDDLMRSLDPDAIGIAPGTFGNGVPISTDNVRRLACDAGILPVVLGGDGAALDYGREQRTAPPQLRAALYRRDGVCAFPGCEHPPGTSQAHHIVEWFHGGETSLTNMVMLCAHHHRIVHSDRWTIAITDGRAVFTPPRRIDPTRTPRVDDAPRPGAHRQLIKEVIPRQRTARLDD
ncbi:HNH endonuclease signature motif containing protein [Saccharopolyspora flava]|nr:HNH endonuclease signature motif containing protein [Saccharopolyspora flava]